MVGQPRSPNEYWHGKPSFYPELNRGTRGKAGRGETKEKESPLKPNREREEVEHSLQSRPMREKTASCRALKAGLIKGGEKGRNDRWRKGGAPEIQKELSGHKEYSWVRSGVDEETCSPLKPKSSIWFKGWLGGGKSAGEN